MENLLKDTLLIYIKKFSMKEIFKSSWAFQNCKHIYIYIVYLYSYIGQRVAEKMDWFNTKNWSINLTVVNRIEFSQPATVYKSSFFITHSYELNK